ncbi:MAG TPA: hypothetical protein VIH89_10345 [Candidatus Sulfotelmatobacter sp.]
MKTKMILVQFLWQKNVNLTVARLVCPTGHLPAAPLAGRRGDFAKLQRFQELYAGPHETWLSSAVEHDVG